MRVRDILLFLTDSVAFHVNIGRLSFSILRFERALGGVTWRCCAVSTTYYLIIHFYGSVSGVEIPELSIGMWEITFFDAGSLINRIDPKE